ncbi:hypothetical protein HNY73_006246 [Argiope bruennichi]|uniref:Uncharacterized protein n=1 Tax=Argiope bruennichi TaxID=94029 RepID=A0A8T0FK95_ARGBR|nr:hypothetical protein HNY73_006246 [Argiope bruennichi]
MWQDEIWIDPLQISKHSTYRLLYLDVSGHELKCPSDLIRNRSRHSSQRAAGEQHRGKLERSGTLLALLLAGPGSEIGAGQGRCREAVACCALRLTVTGRNWDPFRRIFTEGAPSHPLQTMLSFISTPIRRSPPREEKFGRERLSVKKKEKERETTSLTGLLLSIRPSRRGSRRPNRRAGNPRRPGTKTHNGKSLLEVLQNSASKIP